MELRYFVQKPMFDGQLTFSKRDEDAGYDLRANVGINRFLPVGNRWCVGTGIRLAMPVGYFGLIKPRSGLMRDWGVVCDGVVDSGYRGEIFVTLFNHGSQIYNIIPGERIAQIVIVSQLHPSDTELREIYSSDELGDSTRGTSGHGSSGR
jgi:dUTP pyrophosphatase